MDQGGGVEGMAGGLGSHPRGGEIPQFVVDKQAESLRLPGGHQSMRLPTNGSSGALRLSTRWWKSERHEIRMQSQSRWPRPV